MNEATVSILYETITITLDERSVDYTNLDCFLRYSTRHLELVKDLAFEALFKNVLQDRCVHYLFKPDFDSKYISGVDKLARILMPFLNCLKDNGLRSFR